MLKVVIVEDEDIIRKGLAYTIDWLSMDCVVVGEAANGEEGMQKILELRPDIVLADIMMPKMNGMEMLRLTRDKVPYKSIILTSYAEFDYAKEAIELQVTNYLLKPVDVEQLSELISQIRFELQKVPTAEAADSPDFIFDLEKIINSSGKDNPYVVKLIEQVRERYAEHLSLENAAAELGVSASYLSRRFKQITGATFLDFLNKYRISRAVSLLATGEYRIYEISDLTGFSDYKHFSSVFKRYTGKSPTEFTKPD